VNSRHRVLLVVVVLGGLAFLLWPRRVHDLQSPVATGEAPAVGAAPREPADGSRRQGAARRALPHEAATDESLQGTDVAGGLLVDADGNFVPGPESVALFEYFLSMTGEKSPEEILAAIQDEIRKRLEPPAEAQALAFLDRYMLYRERGVALGRSDAGGEDLRARFDRLRSLRREIFGEDLAARLFGDEEAQADVAIRQREVAADPNLTEEEKAARIEKLYDELPAAAREAREQAMAVLHLREDEERIRTAGGSEQDIRELRVERFGEEAADRLEDLDRERAEWDTRFQDYRGERARILADPSLSQADRQAALQRLLESRFDENERVRARALDGLADEQGVAAP